MTERKPCERCGEPFTAAHPTAHKRFCSERCQRNAANARYRERQSEVAECPHCGGTFTRTTTTKHRKVYCSLECQSRARSIDYKRRGIEPPRHAEPERSIDLAGRSPATSKTDSDQHD